ncbi:hypothetical protein SKAU_G00202450 [Synaphobranchus kaupii]|uniref:Uncharacterized protein n=1 Tax=Synaphobranchus kaupii TaxID=118154 RepID=A0A9Q1FFP5_SYNKA|nr:hypothetical protein SKAU_G00202450 [Synaphobranchus kaupii]
MHPPFPPANWNVSHRPGICLSVLTWSDIFMELVWNTEKWNKRCLIPGRPIVKFIGVTNVQTSDQRPSASKPQSLRLSFETESKLRGDSKAPSSFPGYCSLLEFQTVPTITHDATGPCRL